MKLINGSPKYVLVLFVRLFGLRRPLLLGDYSGALVAEVQGAVEALTQENRKKLAEALALSASAPSVVRVLVHNRPSLQTVT